MQETSTIQILRCLQNKKTVNENLVALIAKIGEKITIGKAKTLESSNCKNFTYQHSVIKDNVSKLGVIVSLEINEISDKINSDSPEIRKLIFGIKSKIFFGLAVGCNPPKIKIPLNFISLSKIMIIIRHET